MFNAPQQYSLRSLQTTCQYRGGILVHVDNRGEANFIRKTLKGFAHDPTTYYLNNERWYIGLVHEGRGTTYRWYDDGSPPSFTDWGYNQPQDNQGYEECVALEKSLDFHWGDKTCSAGGRPICEKHAARVSQPIRALPAALVSTPPSSHQTLPVECPYGWIAYDRSCYLFYIHHMKNFHDAASYCKFHNAHLVHVNSAQENSFLRATIRSFHFYYDQWWIGLSDSAHEGRFVWVDDGSVSAYYDWKPYEPSNTYGNEDCVSMVYYGNYLWNDDNCLKCRYFISSLL